MMSVSSFKLFKCIAMSVVALLIATILGGVAVLKLAYPVCYIDYVNQYAKEYSIESELVLGVINAESGFDRFAVSNRGAIGLMQIVPSTAGFIAKDLGIENFDQNMLYDAETNIRFGCYYLAYLFKKFESVEQVLFAYNAGEGTLKSLLDESCGKFSLEKIEIKETKNYIKRVEKSKFIYKRYHNL